MFNSIVYIFFIQILEGIFILTNKNKIYDSILSIKIINPKTA